MIFFEKQLLSLPRKASRIGLLLVGLGSFLSLTQGAAASDIAPILSLEDRDNYSEVFILQEAGKWKQADRIIKSISNPILMGHIKFQRYMHPTKYRAGYEELHLWMKAYYDHPGAHRLHKLAKSRRKPGWKPLSPPLQSRYLGGTGPGQPAYLSRSYKSTRKRSVQTRNNVAHAKRVVRRYLYRDEATNAVKYLEQKKIKKLLDQTEYDHFLKRSPKGIFYTQKMKKRSNMRKLL